MNKFLAGFLLLVSCNTQAVWISIAANNLVEGSGISYIREEAIYNAKKDCLRRSAKYMEKREHWANKPSVCKITNTYKK